MFYYLPQLDYSINEFWKRHEFNKALFLSKPSIVLDPSNFSRNSIFELLLNNSYFYETYEFLFKKVDTSILPSFVVSRLLVRNLDDVINNTYITTSDSSGENLLNITEEEGNLLDLLLDFRLGRDFDLGTVNYSDLTSSLSKLIFLYLNYFKEKKLVESITSCLTDDFSDSRVFVKAFYLYVLTEMYDHLKNLNVVIDSENYVTYFYKFVIKLGSDDDSFELPLITPVLNTQLYLNGNFVKDTDYEVIETGTNSVEIKFNQIVEKDTVLCIFYQSTTKVSAVSVIETELYNPLKPKPLYHHMLL